MAGEQQQKHQSMLKGDRHMPMHIAKATKTLTVTGARNAVSLRRTLMYTMHGSSYSVPSLACVTTGGTYSSSASRRGAYIISCN